VVTELAPVWRAELTRLLPEVAEPGDRPPPERRDHRLLFEAVGELLARLSDRHPLAIVLEDLHWADEMSLRLLAFLGRRLASSRLLLVATAREEDLDDTPTLRRALEDLVREPHVERFTLERLSERDTLALVLALSGGRASAATTALESRVWTLSRGNPFVVVETVRALRAAPANVTPDDPTPLAPRVRELVRRSLERLGESARHVVDLAAVVGREFEFALLERATGLTGAEAAAAMDEAVRRRVLRSTGARFDFGHDWIREVATAEISPPRRRVLHARIAKALETVHAADLDAHALALGLHFQAGEVWDRAVTYLRKAGAQAIARAAYREAIACFERALAALTRLPLTPDTLAQTIDLRFDLRAALVPMGAVGKISEHLREAERLAETLGDPRRLGWVSVLLSQHAWGQGQPAEAFTFASRAHAIAESLGDVPLVALANQYRGLSRLGAGEYDRAAGFFRKTIALLAGGRTTERVAQTGYPAVLSRSYLVMALAERGVFAEGTTHGEDAIRLAEALDHPFSLIQALRGLGYLYDIEGHLDDAARVLERGVTLCREWNVMTTAPILMATLGHAYSLAGRIGDGVSLLEQALGTVESLGPAYHSLCVLRLGDAHLLAGRSAEARTLAERALGLTRKHGERGYEAWSLRLAGDALSHGDHPDPDSADSRYRQALTRAQELGMRPLVAHCHLGLGKLYCRTGKRQEAEEHFTTATTMYREMGMNLWLEKAEAAMGPPHRKSP
jgi:tetratricopeptide (TPR) repeat protein